MIAHEDVGSDTATWYDALDGCYLVQIFLACVLTVHEFQYLVTSALCREVDVLAEIRLLGNGLQDVFAHVFGIRGGEAHTHIWHGLCHHVQ